MSSLSGQTQVHRSQRPTLPLADCPFCHLPSTLMWRACNQRQSEALSSTRCCSSVSFDALSFDKIPPILLLLLREHISEESNTPPRILCSPQFRRRTLFEGHFFSKTKDFSCVDAPPSVLDRFVLLIESRPRSYSMLIQI